ncbi:diguanylate cyclase [Microbacterium sp. QXD-8]|uniref:Diguanylate cyclase n=1 Tax=Microbacterium psychrotolerans TaxID=3068321 RepID=A0ABU0Z7M9_9MICO|nr:diguanylate cyclase [Microbacterium sp. QXD-8]MDQ7879526.1 diguanylate cyclase [Microbacterium sp. QXD-8]
MTEPSKHAWFQGAPCGLIGTSLDGLILEANDTLLEWTGFSRPQIEGRSFTSLLDPGSQLFYETRHAQALPLQGQLNEVALTMLCADGSRLPVLINAIRDAAAGVNRIAVFNASGRIQYERDLLHARRVAESSEAQVRVLQEVSRAFGVSATDEDVAQSFAEVARTAFAAREAGVLLLDDVGELTLVGGTNPLAGLVPPIVSLRNSPDVVVVDDETATARFPQLAAALHETRLAALSVMPLLDADRRLGILVCFFGRARQFDDQFFDLQKALGRQASQTLVRVRLQRRLAFLALHDQLTGVANRQLLEQSLEDALEAASAHNTPLAVMFLDVDEFKSINDRFGHAAGDMVLVELAVRLGAGVRSEDVVGRIGGDEFVAICANADEHAATTIAERILRLTQEPIAIGEGLISASVSVGISMFHPRLHSRPTPEQLLVRADRAMYESKGAGKNRATFETPPP